MVRISPSDFSMNGSDFSFGFQQGWFGFLLRISASDLAKNGSAEIQTARNGSAKLQTRIKMVRKDDL
jgi:hypothetical protein